MVPEPAQQATRTVADRVSRVPASPTLKIAAKARAMVAEGIDVIDLSVGEPDFATPDHIKEAAKRAIDENFTKYTANTGVPELRQAIADRLRDDHGIDYAIEEIIVSPGAKSCLYNLCGAILNAGEEVILPAPYWVSYPAQIALANGSAVILPTREENGFRMTPDEFRAARTHRTKAVIINNPSNPTGTAYSREDLQELAETMAEEGIFIIADEIYEKLVYGDFQFTSIAALGPKVKERTILINGVSKAYSMTGWRIGYAAGPRDVIGAMARIQSHSTSNAASISQMAALEAIRGPQGDVQQMLAEFQKRRDFMLRKVRSIPAVSCVEPRGAFYLFPNVSAYYGKEHDGTQIRDSQAMAYFLLNIAKVAVVPGDAFGADDFIRLSYSTSMEKIEEAMRRIADAMSSL